MKKFISCYDASNFQSLITKALEYKSSPLKDATLGKGSRMGLLFLNPSMRTRLSTEIAAKNLGMDVIVFNVGQDGWALEFEDEAIMSGSTVEPVKEAAPILVKYFDIVGIRTFRCVKN
ncbi:MAG: acetylornithine carbamoyltransferase, partial [Bacteroidota bacterium]